MEPNVIVADTKQFLVARRYKQAVGGKLTLWYKLVPPKLVYLLATKILL